MWKTTQAVVSAVELDVEPELHRMTDDIPGLLCQAERI